VGDVRTVAACALPPAKLPTMPALTIALMSMVLIFMVISLALKRRVNSGKRRRGTDFW